MTLCRMCFKAWKTDTIEMGSVFFIDRVESLRPWGEGHNPLYRSLDWEEIFEAVATTCRRVGCDLRHFIVAEIKKEIEKRITREYL